ncbi:hypothetical protein AB2B41_07285 [Marimonas sp. MJW-29]|uniref:Uncharacterized protein n=1 Tax=Sulfitobacter sediminis TaxID=3234186 RepID=A0ABV3RKB1_9RHOB
MNYNPIDTSVKPSVCRSLRIAAGVFVIGTIGMLAAPTAEAASIVLPGFDLFHTPTPPGAGFGYDPDGPGPIPPTVVPFESFAENIGVGVRCGSKEFDFNDGKGCVATGNTDTIVERLDQASVPSTPGTSAPIDIEMVSLSLVSVDPLNLFGPSEFIGARILKDLTTGNYIYGNDNGSTMDITFDDANGGTWTS